jgi:hypothetical protein
MPPDFTIADAQLNVEQIRLYVERFKAAHAINLRTEIRTEIRADMLRDVVKSLILQLSAKVASKKYAAKTVSYPATWWEFFKHRWFPRRWLARWPVRFATVTLEASAYYPDIEIPNCAAYVDVAVKRHPIHYGRD